MSCLSLLGYVFLFAAPFLFFTNEPSACTWNMFNFPSKSARPEFARAIAAMAAVLGQLSADFVLLQETACCAAGMMTGFMADMSVNGYDCCGDDRYTGNQILAQGAGVAGAYLTSHGCNAECKTLVLSACMA